MDAATVGVLRDVLLLVWLALLLGVVAYKGVRLSRPAASWNAAGRVDAGSYLPADGLVVAALAVLLVGGLQAAPAGEAARAATELAIGPLIGAMAMQLVFCLLLLFYLRSVRGLSPAELFGLRRLSVWRVLAWSLLLIAPILLVVNASAAGVMEWLKAFWPDLASQDSVQAFQKSKDPAARALMIVAAVVVAPLVEETIFRGFIYGVLKRFTDGCFAALCSALLFAVVHFHIGSLLPLTVLALLLCLAYERTGSLLVPMGLHALFNAASLVALLFFTPPAP